MRGSSVRLLLLLPFADAAYCDGPGPSVHAKPNNHAVKPPVLSRPTVYKEVGALFWASHDSGPAFPILHVYGDDPYEWGYAHGTLLKARCVQMWDSFWAYLVAQMPGGEAAIVRQILDVESHSRQFVPSHYDEEMKGLADATGYNYTKIRWLHLYPETADGHCSMFGAWGSATANSAGLHGELLQMRALDYITAPFLTSNHAVIVYHPSQQSTAAVSSKNTVVNVGFIGYVTMVTGVSRSAAGVPLALSEIGVSDPDDTFGPQSPGHGIPFPYLLRDLMMTSASLHDVQAALQDATRTIDLILGFGTSTKQKDSAAPFFGTQYARDHVRFYTDRNLLPVNHTWHTPIDNVVYHGMDWLCPQYTHPLGERLRAAHGSLTAQRTIREINALVQTGSLHVAIYEVANERMFLAHGQPASDGKAIPAYDTAYMEIDVKALIDEPHPSVSRR